MNLTPGQFSFSTLSQSNVAVHHIHFTPPFLSSSLSHCCDISRFRSVMRISFVQSAEAPATLPPLRFPLSIHCLTPYVSSAGSSPGAGESPLSISPNKAYERYYNSSVEEPKKDSASEHQQKLSRLKKRIIFGLGIGVSFGGVVLAGGWVFTIVIATAVFAGAREYFELVRSRGIAAGMTPPPRYVSRVCSVICSLMPILTLYFGHIDVSVTSAAFVVAMTLLLQRGNPRFAQLSSTIFGLFYCGYLPCFWVKLRCGLAAPALNTRVGAAWPILLGGQTHWSVGLVATLISISSIIAADTYAFAGGKIFGRTPLTSISPKKTWEGAVAGLAGCIATSVVLSKIFHWPTSTISAIAFGFLNFFGSLFGDLIESMIKRDAGVKDSGSLIPGHGGILDRVDSYIFTGALAYSFVKTILPLYGV